ncbi:MAG TPA: hypothetical protein PKE04_02105 [Clostridia bacterium]|nr:hypothetical protein [Clostridia bacterium]
MNRAQRAMSRVRRNPATVAGICLIAFFAVLAIFAPQIATHDPKARAGAPYLRPSARHLLGTNDIGQDIFSEMIYGARISLTIGVVAAFVSTAAGALAGRTASSAAARM